MRYTILIVPGFHGSGPAHWQSWLQERLPQARRVAGIDWERPVLADWAAAVGRGIDEAPGPVLVVAHSFGCLASVRAAARRQHRVAGMMLVAPADPERFSPAGLRDQDGPPGQHSIASDIPASPIGMPSLVVASTNDPWVRLSSAAYWADKWGGLLVNVGAAGHINVDSGHGPWPRGLELLDALRATCDGLPLGSINEHPRPRAAAH